MSTILVTGGAGYIGSHCVKHLLQAGYGVVVLDNLQTGHATAVQNTHFIQASLQDEATITQILEQFQVVAVMHFAGSCYVGESFERPAFYYENNVLATLSLLKAMATANVSRLVFSSSCTVYGYPETVPITEAHPKNPMSPYGNTKLAIERMIADLAQAMPLSYSILRYFNAAGADPDGQLGENHHPETHLIPLLLQTASGRHPIFEILGADYPTPDGTCIRDFVHVSDIATAHGLALARLLKEPALLADVFNIGTGCGYSVRTLHQYAEQLTGRTIPTRVGARRPGDPPELVADPRQIHTQLGWVPHYSNPEQLIQTAWQWECRQANSQV